MLARLATGEATVGELAAPYDMSMAAISKHLKVLEKAGLVVQGRDAQYRPRKLDPKPLEELDGWLAEYRQLWTERLGRLENYLTLLQKTERDD
jgi:DNA-binding transcriptional ArsR family regulator